MTFRSIESVDREDLRGISVSVLIVASRRDVSPAGPGEGMRGVQVRSTASPLAAFHPLNTFLPLPAPHTPASQQQSEQRAEALYSSLPSPSAGLEFLLFPSPPITGILCASQVVSPL